MAVGLLDHFIKDVLLGPQRIQDAAVGSKGVFTVSTELEAMT